MHAVAALLSLFAAAGAATSPALERTRGEARLRKRVQLSHFTIGSGRPSPVCVCERVSVYMYVCVSVFLCGDECARKANISHPD